MILGSIVYLLNNFIQSRIITEGIIVSFLSAYFMLIITTEIHLKLAYFIDK